MEEENIVERLPEKSRSLRRTSVKKRLQTEINKERTKVKEKGCKKRLLSKYRRKAANTKERERMKKMNDVFATLKSVIPSDIKDDQEEEKETKVTTLRSAISYINYLKQLIEDCDAGLVDKKEFDMKGEKSFSIDKANKEEVKVQKIVKTPKKISKPVKSEVKSSKPIILDTKWTNYSPKFLENKFSIPKDKALLESRDIYQLDTSCQNILLQPLPDITTFYQTNQYTSSSCSSPRDVNEVSLHISLVESEDIMRKDNCISIPEKTIVDLDLIQGIEIRNVMEHINENYFV